MTIRMIALGLIALALAACGNVPVSADLKQDIVQAVAGQSAGQGFVATDLQSAAFNLDEAVRVGALAANDPAPACLHGALKQLGLEGDQAKAESFVPRRDGLVSEGAVLYVRAQQLKKLQGAGVTVPVGCEALIGRIVLDNAAAVVKAQPGGGLLGLR